MLVCRCDGCWRVLEAHELAHEIQIHHYYRRPGDFREVEGCTVLHLCSRCYDRWVELCKSLGIVVGPRDRKT